MLDLVVDGRDILARLDGMLGPRDAVRVGQLVAPDRLVSYLDPIAARCKNDGRSLASDLLELAGVRPEGWADG